MLIAKSGWELLKKDLEKFLNIFLNEIKKSLKRGERVELRGFGMWSTNIQKPRISRNPKTGESIKVSKTLIPTFKMAKKFYEKLNR